ncbi:hypothetical protein D9M71_592400 [compost metagenome]
MRHLVEHRLGHPLLVEQVFVVPGDQVALLHHHPLQVVQARHGADLGLNDDAVVGLDEEVVAAGFQPLSQLAGFGQRGEEDDRHQLFAGPLANPPRHLEAVHHRHHHIHQHQLRTLLGELGERFQAVGRGDHAMPLAADDGGQQQTVCRVVFSDQHRQVVGHGAPASAN